MIIAINLFPKPLRVVQKVLSFIQRTRAEYFCCSNKLPLVIRREKLIPISVLISVQVRLIQ